MNITEFRRSVGNQNPFFRALLWIFLAINIGSLIVYQFGNMKSDFYHEAAFPLLYAKDILDTKLPFSSDFSGREISPISWPIVYSFLLLLGLKTSLTTVAIANLLFLMLALGVLVWFGFTFKMNGTQILLALVLFTTPWGVRPFKYSWFDQVWIWPMNSYGIYEIFSLILCILALKMLASSNSELSKLKFIGRYKHYLLIFFLFGLNHSRGVFEIYGPVAFTLFCLTLFAYFKGEIDFFGRNLQVFVTTFLATLIGRILIGIITAGVPQYYQQPSQQFTALEQSNFLTKLLSPFLTIFQVFGMNPDPSKTVLSLDGLKLFSVITIVLLIVYLPIQRYLKSNNFEQLSLPGQFMFLHLLYFVLVSFITSLLTNSSGVIRYALPMAISAIFFAPFILSETLKQRVVLTLALISMILPNVAYGALHLNASDLPNYRQTSNYKLMESLLQRNLTFGYAGPWTEDVLVIPFYSEERIHVSLIDVAPLGPHLHADKSWFRGGNHSDKTFVAIPSQLVLMNESFEKLLSASSSQYKVDKWTVLIFEADPNEIIGQLD